MYLKKQEVYFVVDFDAEKFRRLEAEQSIVKKRNNNNFIVRSAKIQKIIHFGYKRYFTRLFIGIRTEVTSAEIKNTKTTYKLFPNWRCSLIWGFNKIKM